MQQVKNGDTIQVHYHGKLTTGETFDSIAKLADYSIHERCTSNNFDWKNSSCIPPTLSYLKLNGFDELGDSFLLHQQLPNLLELNLDASKHFSDLSIPLLPAHLTGLNLDSSSKISGKSFEFLPRCLLRLHLDSSKSIFDSDIQHLPRTLKHVELNRAIHLTELCIADLPPHLEYLSMLQNSKISSSSFPNFPYSLRSHKFSTAVSFKRWKSEWGKVREMI